MITTLCTLQVMNHKQAKTKAGIISYVIWHHKAIKYNIQT